MEDNRPGDGLGNWGLAFATAGVAIAFVMLVFIPFLIWLVTRGMSPAAGN